MAYRRPGVTVTQEFTNTTVAVAALALPCVAVGPAYQLVSSDAVGNYTGLNVTLPYLSLMGGALLDTAFLDPNDPFPITKQPISLTLSNAYVSVLSAQTDGNWNGSVFTDPTSGQFSNVLSGDILQVVPSTGVTIVPAQTTGLSYQASSQRNRLAASVAGQFSGVEDGDLVAVTGASPSVAGNYHVLSVSGDTLILDGNINDGTADSTHVNFTITGNRGGASAGNYVILAVTSANSLTLQSQLPAVESFISYSIQRKVPATATTNAGQLNLTRLVTAGTTGFTADANGIYLPAGLTTVINNVTYTVVSGAVAATYRALRTDMAAEVQSYSNLTEVTAAFGPNQVTPANPLAYGIEVMLQNTVTAVNALGLDENAVVNEELSFTNATEVLALQDLYANAVLSQNPVVHSLFNVSVNALSAPAMKLERVALINSSFISKAILQDELTTVTTVNNARVIVNTQLNGAGAVAQPTVLTDTSSASPFLQVSVGDTVIVQAGTGVVPGTYQVAAVTSGTSITLSASFISSGSPTNIQYYIIRLDGLGADGKTFYDRNASFLASGVAPGHYLDILSGALAGRYLIGAVSSDKQLTLATAIPGVAAVTTSIDYQIDRNLSKNEQAMLIAGYSSSFASRRMVHCWPDAVQVPVGQTLQYVPGYYLCCAVAALCTGLPPQQGFTNLSVSGFLGFRHSSKYFTDTQLDTIAGGGTMVFAQDGPQQPLYVRHQLTTDVSAIKYQELSFTKNVDYAAKILRSAYKGFIGIYNIIDTTMDQLRTTANAVLTFLRETTRVDKIGGVIKSGSLAKLAEDDTQIDTINMTFILNMPIPLNNLAITIQV